MAKIITRRKLLVGFAAAAIQLKAANETILERGPHHAVKQVVRVAMTNGVPALFTNTYTVLQNGLHYLDSNGVWKETQAKFHLSGLSMQSWGAWF